MWPLTCVQAGAGASALSLDQDLARVLLQVSHLLARVLALLIYYSRATPFLSFSSSLACGCACDPLPHPQPPFRSPGWAGLRSKPREAKCPPSLASLSTTHGWSSCVDGTLNQRLACRRGRAFDWREKAAVAKTVGPGPAVHRRARVLLLLISRLTWSLRVFCFWAMANWPRTSCVCCCAV
jgi:hypothetical protein